MTDYSQALFLFRVLISLFSVVVASVLVVTACIIYFVVAYIRASEEES